MKRVLLFLSLVVSFGYFAVSQTTNVSNEENISFNQLLKQISGEDLKNIDVPQSDVCAPIPELDDKALKTVDFKNDIKSGLQKEFQKPGPGYIWGPYHPPILDNAYYKYAQKYPPLLQQHENPIAYQLLAEWRSIESIKGTLLQEAYDLNSKDSTLYAEGVQLAKEREALKQEIDKYNAEVAAYNQQCAGQPVTPPCTNWYNRLVAWRADLVRRVNIHIQKVQNWNSRVEGLKNLVDSLAEKIRAWQNRINDFISKCREFLNDYTCTKEEYDQLRHTVWLACLSVPMSCNKTQDCATLQINIGRHKACINAHINLTNRCFGGVTPPGHQQEINEREQGKKNCIKIYEEKCGPYVPDPAFRTVRFD